MAPNNHLIETKEPVIDRRKALKSVGLASFGAVAIGGSAAASKLMDYTVEQQEQPTLFSDDFADGELSWTDVDHPEFWSEQDSQLRYRPSSSAGSTGDNALYADETVDGDRGTLEWPLAIEFLGGATHTAAGLGALAVEGGPKDWGPTVSNVRLGISDSPYNDDFHVWNSTGKSFTLSPPRENNTWHRYRLVPDIEANVLHVERDDTSWTVPEPRTEPLGNIAIVVSGGTCWGCGGAGHRRYQSISVSAVGGSDPRDGTPTDQRDEGLGRTALSGRVVDVRNRPVSGAAVRAFHVQDDTTLQPGELIAETVSGPDGRPGVYEFTNLAAQNAAQLREQYPGFVFVVAKTETQDSNQWCGSLVYTSEDFFGETALGDTLMTEQLLFGPEHVVYQERSTGAVSVWRTVSPDDLRDQTLYIEIVSTDSDIDNPVNQPRRTGNSVANGGISFRVPEDVSVSYPGDEGVNVSMYLREWQGATSSLTTWHPLRSNIGAPFFVSTEAFATQSVTEYTDRQQELDEDMQTAWQYVMGSPPVVGTLYGFYKALSSILADESSSIHTTVGDGSESADLNEVDVVNDGWSRPAEVVVLQVPIEFTANREEPFVARSFWSSGGVRSAIDHPFSVGPDVNAPGGES